MEQAGQPIEIRGRYLWKGNDRFLVRGVVYQIHDSEPPIDPIADDRLPQLQHDVVLFRELGVNTIFVYHIDNSKSHTRAMKILEEAGIYVLANIPTPMCCIKRFAPYESYNANNLNSFFRTVDAIADFPNTLGMLAAHFLINNERSKSCAPVISAVVRDLKRYMKFKSEAIGQRVLPVGYGAATTNEQDRAVLDYLSSGDDRDRIDFWTCTGWSLSSAGENGYEDLISRYRRANLPIFISEYGNCAQRPRDFEDTKALYSPQMTKVFSGGCVYEFWYGANRFGVVKMRSCTEDALREDPKLTLDHTRDTEWGTLLVLQDFKNYKARLLATKEVETTPDHTQSRHEENTGKVSNVLQSDQQESFRDIGQVPESCVNWTEVETGVRNAL